MALNTIQAPYTKAVALSTSYLGVGNEISITGAEWLNLWLDDDAKVMTLKYKINGGDFVEIPAGAVKDVWEIDGIKRNTSILIDAKADAGTPNLNILAV
jgi:hypothetical protein